MLLILLLLSCLCFPARAGDLDQRVTIRFRNISLKTALDRIAAAAKVVIIYSDSGPMAATVSLEVNNQPLREVLHELLAPYPLTYQVIDGKIVIGTSPAPVRPASPIRGKVTDTAGMPLAGATVRVKGQAIKVTCAADGTFSLPALSPGTVLQITYVSYLSREITLRDDRDLVIVLREDAAKLSEVRIVSNGYQSQPAERVTGSFTQPIKAAFDARVSTDVLSRLNGITSGLVFNANTTTAKNGTDINIRGRSTIFANDQPLIVVDNFPYSGAITNINPNDVETVTVLKDAAAASIWGVRAGNGVIVITTKKGTLNRPLQVNFNANLTVSDRPDLSYNPNQLDAGAYISIEQFLFGKGFYNANLANTTTYPVTSPVVDLLAANRAGTLSSTDLETQLQTLRSVNVNDQLQQYFYRRAVNQQYAFSLSGGTAKASYYFSAGDDRTQASTRANGGERITLNSQNTFAITPQLEFNAGLNVVQTTNQSDNILTQVRSKLFPYSRLADDQGNPLAIPYAYNQAYVQSAPAKGFLDWSYVPLNELGATGNVTKLTDLRLSTSLKYTLFPGLNAQVSYQYQGTNSQGRLYQSQQTYYTRNYINTFSTLTAGKVSGYNVPLGGILNLNNGQTTANNIRGALNFDRSWGEHRVTALAGYELSQTNGDTNQSVLYGYNDQLATFTTINPKTAFPTNPTGSTTIASGLGIASTLVRLRSSFANAAYTYRGRYTLSGSARVDGTNYFGVATNQKSVPLWSAGAKWIIDQEPFYQLDWLPRLALRASYGYNGNLIQSVTGVTTFLYLNGAQYTNLNYAQVSNLGNPDLRWEKTAITNLAVDFATKDDRLTGSLEYYLKKETDLLGFKTFPENSGITSLQGNYADMSGHGFDLSLTSHNLNGALQWSTTLLISHATDRVTRYAIQPLATQLTASSGVLTGATPNIGKPVYGIYAYRWGGLDPATGNPIGFLNGQPSQNYATITTNTPVSDLVYIGPARPVYFGGLYNRFQYRGFSLGIQLSYKLGYYFMAPALSYTGLTSSGAFLKVNRDFNRRWQNPGDEQHTHVPSLIYPTVSAREQFYQYSSINMLNAGQIRLQDISLSYDIPRTKLQVYLYANNIGILWRANKQGLDPDAVPGPGDNTTMPVPRSWALGLKANF
ncbi:MAG: SusC/RagA family TonB-linked outer membrane protein [Mucilaginibacter sp.]